MNLQVTDLNFGVQQKTSVLYIRLAALLYSYEWRNLMHLPLHLICLFYT